VSEDTSFRDLMSRLRSGDGEAAAALVRRYEPYLRRAVRVHLRDPRLRRQLDSLDICQEVLASFFLRAALGQYELASPEQLLRLLTSMVRNKVANQVNKQAARRRDYRRVEAGEVDEQAVPDPEGTPSQVVAGRELVEEGRRRLSPEERRLLEWRDQGREWADIAAEVGSSPEALRKKLERAIDRVARELGLGEG
jgi:RNA polymerase sigma-70 factor (ECF subfamily)